MNQFILEISSVVICLFCLNDCNKNRIVQYRPFPKGFVNKIRDQRFAYYHLLICLMLSAIFDVLAKSVEHYYHSAGRVFVAFSMYEGYFIFHTILPLLFAAYLIDMSGAGKDKDIKFFGLFMLPCFIGELLVWLNPFIKVIFYVDDNGDYHRSQGILSLYALAAIYIVIAMAYFLKYKNKISKMNRISLIIILGISLIGLIIQGIFVVNVELFFESIGMLSFLLLLEERKPTGSNDRRGGMTRGFVMIIAFIFITVIAMNISLLYHANTDQTNRIGEIQIGNLKGELQQSISESESDLLHFSMGLEQLINESATLKDIEDYIAEQREYYIDLTGGNCFNAYAASTDWTIIPEFDMPDEYHAVERVWYIGARQHPGQVYITEPYIDADTGDLCYTFSYLLSDGKTVTSMDYTLSKVQEIVGRMRGDAEQFSMIVTDDGTIIGCVNEGFQGKKMEDVLPQYEEVFERVKASNEHRSFRTKIGRDNCIVFSNETGNGWKLIISVDYNTFYADILDQMIMLAAIDAMMVAVIIVFYLVSVNNQEKAEETLASTENFLAGISGDLRTPLNDIINISDMYIRQPSSDSAYALREIKDAGRLLQERLDNLFSYSNMVREKLRSSSTKKTVQRKETISSKYIRNGIVSILIVAMLIGLTLCLGMTTRWGSARISKEADRYNSEVTLWMQQKQSILRMFSDVIAADPEILSDYDAAVEWLDDITSNYSDMTFAYMANPYNKEHQIIMNNGWVPDPDYKVEERQWYIDTERSGDGYSISAPYFDAQTGLYCITFSRSVYSKEGEFLGIFAIDCLMDKLIDVLDDSYTSTSYAFMVDQDGIIINHPYKYYEIDSTTGVYVEDTEYAEAYHKGSAFRMHDYDGRSVACYCEKSELSGFTVIVVQSWWSIYGAVLLMAMVFLIMLVVSIVAVAAMINRFLRWQDETNEKLVEAANAAVAAEKAKSRFLAQMSHEIRTPINAVLGMNEMIMRESDDESIREYSSNIHSAGRNLLGLINSILDFSKIEEGKMEIIPVRYDTATMIGNMINSVSRRAADKDLVFEAHIDENLPSVLYGDDMRITQVAINLLTNAVKYTREGRVDLFVSFRPIREEVISLAVRVTDTGIGIKEEDKARLFESFTRLEETRNRNIEGTGLGMSIVNKLLDMMGSKLEVHSVYGEGSDFAFEVQQTVMDAAPIGNYEEKVKNLQDNKDDDTYLYAPEAKLLVVDDNGMNLKVIKNLLKLNGITPDLAGSGTEALSKMENNTYDVIMLDHMMPEMDGIQTLHNAKDRSLIAEGCAVIALTANAVVGAREMYLVEGFDDYLSKPVDVKALENALGKYLPEDKVSYKSKADKKKKDAVPSEPAKVVESVSSSDDIMEFAPSGSDDIMEFAPSGSDDIMEFAPGGGGSSNDGGDTESLYKALNDAGVITADGLSFCAGDDEFYREILEDYASSCEDRLNELDDALSAGDYKAYAIKVHALKSTARTVGDSLVFENARALELAAEAGEETTVDKDHPALKEEYRRKAELIRNSLQ